MKITLIALLVGTLQAVHLKTKEHHNAMIKDDDDATEYAQEDPASDEEPWKNGAYLADDHRAILQADPNDPRWITYTEAMKGEDTHQGIQGAEGITADMQPHFAQLKSESHHRSKH